MGKNLLVVTLVTRKCLQSPVVCMEVTGLSKKHQPATYQGIMNRKEKAKASLFPKCYDLLITFVSK